MDDISSQISQLMETVQAKPNAKILMVIDRLHPDLLKALIYIKAEYPDVKVEIKLVKKNVQIN